MTIPAIEIEDFTPPAEPLQYAEHVAALIQAQEDAPEGHERVLSITIPEDEAAKHRRYFSKAANAADKTARVRAETKDEENGTVTFKFALVARQHRERKSADENGENGEQLQEGENSEAPKRSRRNKAEGDESATVSDEASGE